ncbi:MULTISPECIES: LysR family transcriptional regulator [unclassified Burkholderia]|uniref:LysR family transcriptional regulator n=1 Tax=unclassified Burkholderia TaxID=2613784 RepID=UPI000F56E048|nr:MULTISPECIES: LysR family transcriptional regulator [unclassified Burkholderia]RQR32844.1 LysR family transcriptional regulator [Burkholderia sp. Bp9131]RQR64809.1 LysR family transcriptional regulator [Burkholderia sp. Bp9015]RQR74155.1 LysR family transcriptional regulator [Burkholderia sp. Bp9011]RQR85968.1 LysR family transcriptional regulator [Burkholderia sp. Bp9010]RQS66381.1 LysR family transcriptional regulator [Burkholderia sp. Bp8977]
MAFEKFSGLPAFVRSVEAGSFTAAARSLETTPSAVSRSVARLEKRLGVTLFQRSTRAFVLTSEGQTYYERVAPLMRGLEDASDVLTTPEKAVGKLRVSLPVDLGRTLLEPITRELMGSNPELSLEVNISDRHVDVIREGFDVAIRAGCAVDSRLYAHTLMSLPLVLVASPNYLLKHGMPKGKDDLVAHLHVRYKLDGRVVPIVFADGTSIPIDGMFDADNGDAMRVAALNGLGIAQILRTAVQPDLDSGRLTEVLPDVKLSAVPVIALHAFGKGLPARARIFIDFVSQQLARSR